MPELPEVETLCRGLMGVLAGRRIRGVIVRRTDLRWPVPHRMLVEKLPGTRIIQIARRAKYLLLETGAGWVIVHLGMSGVLRVVSMDAAPGPHDHIDVLLDSGQGLRLTDPRRFGAVLWGGSDPLGHEVLRHLGPEPLAETFDGQALHVLIHHRKRPIKTVLMDGRIIAGIGNIYAVESLFQARLHPLRPATTLTPEECHRLALAIKDRLTAAIARGGTTLRDFRHSDGRPGYFQQSLRLYGREGTPCPICSTPIAALRLGGRASPFCPDCQQKK
ncbi:MAG: bifunctional DNA-formamidopyrimidine glycosylase/DNA-(apurinic or apyrimidinic site) lyase [Magnetococcales bacterium]|nr:bifunctional DNA-formamidopyrimidine glycosylase/DNA-(apurinic or apyrimidinic site) lyase [Magnetococcales bacterium]